MARGRPRGSSTRPLEVRNLERGQMCRVKYNNFRKGFKKSCGLNLGELSRYYKPFSGKRQKSGKPRKVRKDKGLKRGPRGQRM